MVDREHGEKTPSPEKAILLDSPELTPRLNLTEGPAFDSRMVEMVQALAGCDADAAEDALQRTTQLDQGDPMSWCSRAVVLLRRQGRA